MGTRLRSGFTLCIVIVPEGGLDPPRDSPANTVHANPLFHPQKGRCLHAEEWRVGYRMMAIEVEDMDQAVEYLKTRGIGISWGPAHLGKSKRAVIRDPDGHPIELRQW